MKLIIGIVHSDDAHGLTSALLEKGYYCTKISTTGGFLREGNATLLIGTEEENVQEVLSIIKANCHTRTQFVSPLPPIMEPEAEFMTAPIEITIRGATVFIVNVEQFWRF